MKKKIIFGVGDYGQSAYLKMKDQFEIMFFVDNNFMLDGTELFGIPVLAGEKLREVYTSEMDVVICSKDYFQISAQLVEMEITDYYVMLEGFLYHSSSNETMMPLELNKYSYLRKGEGEKNILYVQNTSCVQAHKIAALMKENGYKVYLLYTMAFPEVDSIPFINIYDGVFVFYTADAIVDFVENSEFDIVHSSNDSAIITNILLSTTKHIVLCSDKNELIGDESVEKMILSYMANVWSDGHIYSSLIEMENVKRKYDVEGTEETCLGNTELNIKNIVDFYEKVKKRKVVR